MSHFRGSCKKMTPSAGKAGGLERLRERMDCPHTAQRGERGSSLPLNPRNHRRVCSILSEGSQQDHRGTESTSKGAVLVKSQDQPKVPCLPVIQIRTEQTTGKASSKQVFFPAYSASQLPQRPSQARRKKCVPVLSVEMSPWGGPSLSESSFTTIPPREKDRVPPAGQDTGSRGRAPRKPPLRPRLRTATLPPLRSVSNLSFSRSFTFSFFELPEHQTLQHRLERQREVQLLMRELQL
ncbi:uncharacterized protein LOC121298080 [Polyodon spathula]|uniref:uncharacterized protein LOC121298080 n=1 Tax=Polyodon spathula TaxID=7913 RepID=UPI001B7EB315|nr:uncharacterized protein LOC121298080 [Polyodon spathula]